MQLVQPVAVESGTAKLVGADSGRIVAGALDLLDDPEAHGRMASALNPYGDGQAAARIADAVSGWLQATGGKAGRAAH